MTAIRLSALPPEEAMAYFRSKGLAPAVARFDYRDVWRGQHASSFVVAKAMQDDVATMLREGIARAQADGTGFRAFADELEPQLRAAGWWGRQQMTDPLTGETTLVQLGSLHRLRTIFDTNMRGAAAAGRWAQIQRTRRGFPYLRYRQIDRPTRRLQHKRFDGLVRPVDDPVWARIYPPNGWFCGCWVEQITQGQVDRGEVEVSPPFDLDEVEWENARTGRTEEVPRGVHPGFDVNPGMIWLDTARRMEGIDGQDNAAELRGVGTQLRQLALRDGYERGAFVAADGAVLDVLKGTPDDPSALRWKPVDVFRGADFIHTHPGEGVFSFEDFESFYWGQLRSISFLTPGGSFGALFATDRNGFVAARDLFGLAIGNRRDVLGALSREDRNLVIGHALGLWLDREGVAAYHLAATGRLSERIASLSNVIDGLIDVARAGRD